MFTGIVQGKAIVLCIDKGDNLYSFEIKFPGNALLNVERGASIAINGTCLTVTDFDVDESKACFDVMKETLSKTNLKSLSVGAEVNYERAARIGDEIGGHMMSGHIYSTVKILNVLNTQENCSIFFETPPDARKYLLTKGFVGLNGCSLTLGDVSDESFNVHLIPETLDVTTFRDAQAGQLVNLEIDPQTQAIVDTVEAVLKSKNPE